MSTLAGDTLSAEGPFFVDGVLPVAIEIAGSCRVHAADLRFGGYVPNSGAPLPGETTIRLTCTIGLGVEVGLDAGQASGATIQDRRMMSGPDALRYGLYQDAARSLTWGNTAGVDTVHVEGGGVSRTVTVFGQIPARQQVPAGQYSDTITVHVYY